MNTKNLLTNDDARALAYFAVGVSSEGSIGGRDVSNRLSFAGKENGGKKLEPVGNSGYSLGTLQTDLGAHPEVAQLLVAAYQAWAKEHQPEWVFSDDQQRQTIADLGRNGHTINDQHGRALHPQVKSHLDEFLKADAGKTFVHERDELQVNRLTRPDGVLPKLQTTSLYLNSSADDQARLATIALKIENQTGGQGAVFNRGKDGKSHKVVDGLVEGINKGDIKSMHNVTLWVDKHPKYVRDGVAHALQGTETYLRLEHADPKSDLYRAWQSIKANATTDPGKLDPKSALGKDYVTVKDQFLHPTGYSPSKRHAAVIELQTKLGQLGYTGADGKPLQPDGSLGPRTQHAIKAFQHDQNLKEDGVAGLATLKAIEAQFKALGAQKQAAPEADATPHITDKTHPGNSLFKQAQTGMQAIDVKFGRPSDQQTDNAAGYMALKAQNAGMTRIDVMDLSDKGDKIIAAQGQPGSAHSKVIDEPTVTALNTPLAESSQAFADAHQAMLAANQSNPKQTTPNPTQQQTALSMA